MGIETSRDDLASFEGWRRCWHPSRGFLVATGALVLCLLPAASHARVVMVGIDGGSWNLIDAGVARGELPHFAALLARGASAELETVEPVFSPTVWTSVATGRSPEAHGILNFRQSRSEMQVATIWERLAAQDVRVGLYDYLISWPPVTLPAGFVIPGWLRRDGRTTPPDVFERAGVAPYVYSTRRIRSAEAIYANCLQELEEKPGRFLRLLEAYELDVATVTFYALDAASHRFWHRAYPEQFEAVEVAADDPFRDAIARVLRGLDAALGRIDAALGPDDTLLIVSDHGFRARQTIRRRWTLLFDDVLANHGFDPERDAFTLASNWRNLVFEIYEGPYAEREATLQRLVELLESVRDEAGESLFEVSLARTAYAPSTLARWRQVAADAVWGAGERYYREDRHAVLVASPAAEGVAASWPDGEVRIGASTLRSGDVFFPSEFSGDHDPTGIFVAAGRDIVPRSERRSISVLEIAPLVAYLAGAALPDDLEAALPAAWLSPERLAGDPPRSVPARALHLEQDEQETSEALDADEEDLTERLRSLGYAE